MSLENSSLEDLGAPSGALDFTQQPSYIVAADNHNIASGNGSWWDKTIGSTLESLSNAPKYWGLALGSGVTSILNSGIAVANLFNNDQDKIKDINYGQWVQDYDTDLGKYYRENANSIDTWGFVATSIVPGTLGIKALNMGQKALQVGTKSGMIGAQMSRATGLLVPQAESYILRAAPEIAATKATSLMTNTNVLKAIGMKAGQQTLEAAAFETAVLASSFKSPFFDDMEAKDIAVNFGMGVLLGGGIGTLLSIPGVRGAVKKEVTRLDQAGKIAVAQEASMASMPTGIKLGVGFQNRETMEKFIAENQAHLDSGVQLNADGLTTEIVQANVAKAKNSITDINNQVRTHVNSITADAQVGNYFADNIIGLSSSDGLNATLSAEQFLRAANVKKAVTPLDKIQMNLGLVGGVAEDTGTISWSKLYGSGKGDIIDELPDALPLADIIKLKPGDKSIEDAVNKYVKKFSSGLKSPGAVAEISDLTAVQARYLWASRYAPKSAPNIKVLDGDIPMMEMIYRNPEKFQTVQIVDSTGKNIDTITGDVSSVTTKLFDMKDQAVKKLITSGKSVEEIAERTNVSPGYIAGTEVSTNFGDNMLYRQSVAEAMGLENASDIFFKPQYMGIKQSDKIKGLQNQFEMDADALIRSYRKAAQITTDNAVAEAGAIYGQGDMINSATGQTTRTNYTAMLPEAEDVNQAIASAHRFGSGARIFSFSNGNYGSAEAAMQRIGSIKQKMDVEASRIIDATLSPVLQSIRNSPAAAAEFAVTRELVARSGETYVMRDGRLVVKKIADWQESNGTTPRPQITPGAKEEIIFNYPEARQVWEAHIDLNSQRLAGTKSLRAAQGLEFDKVLDAAYAPKPDPRRYQYFAFVVDPTITGAGKTTMIHARDAANLDKMIARTQQEFPQFKVIRKDQSEDYHKALGDFEYDKTLNDNYIDSSLASRGINSQFLPKTDGNQIAAELLDWHRNRAKAYNGDIISTKYEAAFRELESLGKEYGGLNTSKYPDAYSMATNVKKNPYVEYMKTAMNVSNISEYPMLVNANQFFDNVVSNLWNKAGDMMQKAKSSADLDAINQVFADQGFKTAYYDAATEILANHRADTQVLSKFVRGANAILATTFLRMDWLNAINNKLGSTILTSTELSHVLSQIGKGDAETVGKLASLSRVEVPGTGGQSILSAPKLIMRANQNFVRDLKDGTLGKLYKDKGWIPENYAEIQRLADSITLNGSESTAQVSAKLDAMFQGAKAIGDFGEKITGNKFIETMNRFMAADVMRQITDLAVERGIMGTKEADIYINTFVNRTQVNMTAAQRPLAFQGPIGMAMGLFQSYQFNMMQQLFRYAQPGSRKDIAMLMGMQGSVYGLNGLPGFQQFNEHIIAQAAGNHEHNDMYSKIYGSANYGTANFMLYGLPSNLLRTNLYTRGDLTPQHPTILPGSISDMVVPNKVGAFFSNLWTMSKDVANGNGVWNSFLTGLEHNSVNRPLAGLAQTLRGVTSPSGQVVSTTMSGELIGANDLFSLSTLARLAGGKPLDESIVREERFRIQAYQKADAQKKKDLGATLTRGFEQGAGSPDLDNFYKEYLGAGGKSNQFNKWTMEQYLRSTANQAARMRSTLSDPYNQRMQALLGGAGTESFMIQQ